MTLAAEPTGPGGGTGNGGIAQAVLDKIGAEVTIGGFPLPLILDVAVVVVPGAGFLGFAIRALQKRD